MADLLIFTASNICERLLSQLCSILGPMPTSAQACQPNGQRVAFPHTTPHPCSWCTLWRVLHLGCPDKPSSQCANFLVPSPSPCGGLSKAPATSPPLYIPSSRPTFAIHPLLSKLVNILAPGAISIAPVSCAGTPDCVTHSPHTCGKASSCWADSMSLKKGCVNSPASAPKFGDTPFWCKTHQSNHEHSCGLHHYSLTQALHTVDNFVV